MSDYIVSPVPGSYREKFTYGGASDPLYIKYLVRESSGMGRTRLFSITKLDDKVYSLVDFDDFRQRDKHYTSWERAFNGMHCICRRVFSKAS